MRTFIAIELPKEIKEYLAGLQEQLKSAGADVKWVRPDNIHLTLKFLGEIDDKTIDIITKIMEDITKNKNTFYIRTGLIGAFPKINFPRVIWVGINEGDAETKELSRDLEEKIAKIGIPKENKPFSSHITIGRMRSPANQEKLVQYLGNMASNFGKGNQQFAVTKITLFRSTLTPKGPVYETLKEASFKNT